MLVLRSSEFIECACTKECNDERAPVAQWIERLAFCANSLAKSRVEYNALVAQSDRATLF